MDAYLLLWKCNSTVRSIQDPNNISLTRTEAYEQMPYVHAQGKRQYVCAENGRNMHWKYTNMCNPNTLIRLP